MVSNSFELFQVSNRITNKFQTEKNLYEFDFEPVQFALTVQNSETFFFLAIWLELLMWVSKRGR